MKDANTIAAGQIVAVYGDMESFDQQLADGDITSDNMQQLLIDAIEADRAQRTVYETAHESGCRPDPAHPGWWICTEPGHTPNGYYEEMAQ